MNAGSHTSVLKRLRAIGTPYWASPQRRRALLLLFLTLGLLAAVTGVNVWVASVAGKFVAALESKNLSAFRYFLLLHIGVIFIATPLIVIYHYVKARIALEWRTWLTEYFVNRYFAHRSYYKLARDPDIDNPDERICQDVDSFCNLTVGLTMSVIDSLISIVTFSGVLYVISPTLMVVVIGYCVAGCLLTALIGAKLPKLNFQHLKLEADLRYSLADVRRDVEPIAFFRGEDRAAAHIVNNLGKAMKNVEAIIVLNRNLSLFTTSYNWFVGLIPAAVIAPLYFQGGVEFGEITRAGIAFSHVFGGLSLFIAQFGSLSAYKANIDRLGSFLEKLEGCVKSDEAHDLSIIQSRESASLQLDRVTILTPDGTRALVKDLTLNFYPGESLMIIGPSGSGKSAILRSIAGLWTAGEGTISRPPMGEVMFLPQQPYVPVSTLREALCYPRASTCAATPVLLEMLKLVNLSETPVRVGGLDVERNWREVLSLGEQQRLSFARLILAAPRFAFLDEATSALDPENQRVLYTLLKNVGATVISVGHRESLREHHEFILELKGDGSWRVYATDKKKHATHLPVKPPAEMLLPKPVHVRDHLSVAAPHNGHRAVTPADESLLTQVQQAHFRYFQEFQAPGTGLTLDRSSSASPVSIAALGFGLSAYGVAHSRGWISSDEAFSFYRRVLERLRAGRQGEDGEGVSGHRGWFYHYLVPEDGTRATHPRFWDSELSSLDTAMLMMGIRFLRALYPDESEDARWLRLTCDELFHRVEWQWMLSDRGLLRHGWTPEGGWLPYEYQGYSEALLLYLLALGADGSKTIPSEAWTEFLVNQEPRTVCGETYLVMPGTPLFCYQTPHCWIDFRGIKDDLGRKVGFDYFENSVRATRAQQKYAMANPYGFLGYSALQWGFTACDGPGDVQQEVRGVQRQFFSYRERGAPEGNDDGTISPVAAVAAMPFTPDASLRSLSHFMNRQPSLFGSCGLYPAFNDTYPTDNGQPWVDREWVGIDQGPVVMMIENYRSGLIWQVMRDDPVIKRGLIRAGFEGGWLQGGTAA